MNLDAILEHHLLDRVLTPLFSVGGVQFAITRHLVIMWCVALFLLAVLTAAARGRSRLAGLLRVGVEAVALYLRDQVVEPLLGHEGRKHTHYFLTLFFFILGCNLAGLIPGSGTATGNIVVTAGLSICTFCFIVLGGIRAQGLWGFLKHFSPVPPGMNPCIGLPLGALLFVIESFGVVVKCIALTIRLFANMIAGHIVILGFFSLIFIIGAASQAMGLFVAAPFALAMVVFVSCMEVLIGVLQAFIFTLLTAVFVGGVMHGH